MKSLNNEMDKHDWIYGIVMILAVICIIAMVFFRETTGAMNMEDYTIETYTVRPGDTFWDISVAFCPADVDVRNYMDKLMEYNGYGNNPRELEAWTTIKIFKYKKVKTSE